jgi:hypothetical protein
MDEVQLITLYCFVDDFVKTLSKLPLWKSVKSLWEGRRGPKRQLSLQEVITLNIMRFHLKIIDLKAFHRLASLSYRHYFPKLPNYENFLKASNKSLPVLMLLLWYLLFLNRESEHENVFFMDSTALSVCDNHYIYSHKVAKGFAARGKTTKGWFYGFKLHGVCDEMGNLLHVVFTPGNINDNLMTEQLTKMLDGLFVADAGYLLKAETFKALFEKHKRVMAAARKNMKRLMTAEQKTLLRKRSIIETTWDVLKERFEIVYHLARSMNGTFRHYLCSLISFLLRPLIMMKTSPALPPLAPIPIT